MVMKTIGMGRPPRKQRRVVLSVGIVIIGSMLGLLGWLAIQRKTPAAGHKGLNPTLPAAHLKAERPAGKLDIVEKAERDSARRAEVVKGDPFGRLSFGTVADSSAKGLAQQLEKLKTLLRPAVADEPREREPTAYRYGAPPAAAPVEGLREVLRTLHAPDTNRADPQLDRLGGMLDKIIRIQRGPGATADTNKPMAVAMAMEKPVTGAVWDEGGFYGLDDEEKDSAVTENAFQAVIPESQVLVAGATIALRLMEPATIGRVTVPRDELLYGRVSLSGDRLLVTVNSVRVGSGVYPVALQVYDLDGMAGIHVPGAITRDVLKQSAAQGVNGLGVVTTDGSLGAQAAEAGIQTARTLFSRKMALVQVTVPAGYRVLLRNQSLNNH
jgi:hypothetical protein